jgi:hypothetical protein
MQMAVMMNLFTAFWDNPLNRAKLMPFLEDKASILFLLAVDGRGATRGK